MSNNFWAFVLLTLPMVAEILLDRFEFMKGRRDKKALDVALRAAVLLPLSWLAANLSGQTMWQGFILATGIYVMFFDFAMGYIVKKNIFYLGNTAKLDRLFQYLGPPWGQIIGRGILFGSAYTAYYDLGKITGLVQF